MGQLTKHLGEVGIVQVGVLIGHPLPLHLGPHHEGVHRPPDPLLLPRPLFTTKDSNPRTIVRPASSHHTPAPRSWVAGGVAWVLRVLAGVLGPGQTKVPIIVSLVHCDCHSLAHCWYSLRVERNLTHLTPWDTFQRKPNMIMLGQSSESVQSKLQVEDNRLSRLRRLALRGLDWDRVGHLCCALPRLALADLAPGETCERSTAPPKVPVTATPPFQV